MKYRQLDENNDFNFGMGLSNYLQDSPETVAQAVQTRLQLWENEWFLDISEGTPYFYGMLGKYTSDTIDPLIKARILETEGVLQIDSYNSIFNGETREYLIYATISTTYGSTEIYGVL